MAQQDAWLILLTVLGVAEGGSGLLLPRRGLG